ncbi:MAG: cell division protein ZapA [Bacteroidales bacterium]|jgi:cell division protein ZapA (FtsZ GTPase activity inhibitor)|nr:cell division protein ZapA [Bacteroidales bacterium]MDD3161780.1 cell division protein ZapA [Bacteroidales bacterium]MDD4821057.1 cell division protein ZapA [Bacteroidales bacterium]
MDNEEMLAITVLIADRTYRLNIRRDEEEVVRKAAKMIEDKLNLYGNRYKVDKDERDKYLSMIALDLAVNFCKMDSEKDMEPMADKIKELNLELKKYLGI